MKYYLYLLLSTLILVSCDNFLDTESFTTKNTGNFPKNKADIDKMLTGIYSIQNVNNPVIKTHPYFVSELASDERLGGCGENSFEIQCLDKLMITNPNQFDPIWNNRYEGIFRANMLIEKIDQCKGEDLEASKDAILGQAYFLRAIYYWDLVQLFERVPLVLHSESSNLPKATVEELYAQIGSDLIYAIKKLPNVSYNETEFGRATKWAAEGFLGRVFLFYTGFYEKDSMPLNDSKDLSKGEMISYLDDCISNSGHHLLNDFRNLWSYSNKYTKKDWSWAIDNDLCWAGDNNPEVMYTYTYAKIGSIAETQRFKNFFILWQGLPTRISIDKTFPYAGGWAMGCVCPKIWNDWVAENPNDIRREGSIIDLDREVPVYKEEGFDSWEETMYRAKKFMPVSAYNDDNELMNSFTVLKWGMPNIAIKAYVQGFPIMRFADVLLMASELKQDVVGINMIRTRANLSPIQQYSLKALQNERRWELSFEGVRWNDIRRWHIAEQVLGNQTGVVVYNRGFKTKMPSLGGGYVSRYKETRGFWAIPQDQINLSNGILKQNEGWLEGQNYEYMGWH